MSLHIGDVVLSKNIKKTKYKFYPTEFSKGVIKKAYKTGIFVEWETTPPLSCWCRYGEVRRHTVIDDFLCEFRCGKG